MMNPKWFYAKDGQPTGPVDLATITQLYRDGKIAPDGLIWQDGTPDWIMASSVLGAPGAAATPGSWPQQDGGSGQIDFEACFAESWSAFKAHWPLMVAAGGIFFFISGLIQGPFQIVQMVMKDKIASDISFLLKLMGLSYGVSLIFTPPLTAGFFQFCVESLRDKPRLETLFKGFRECWLQTSLCALVMGLLILVGLFCLIIPGIYLAIAYYYAIPLVIDRKMGFWEAMELSRKTVHKQWFMVFAVTVISMVFSLVGLLLCCVGVIGTLPFGYLIAMQAYRQLFAAAPPKVSG